MIQEIAHIEIKPGSEEAFVQGVSAAAPLFQRAPGCHGLSLQRCIEHPASFRLVVDWDTVEDHMVGFRESADFQRWRELVAHCFAQPPQVVHMQTLINPF